MKVSANVPRSETSSRLALDLFFLIGFCAFLFFYGLGRFGLIGADEPRYAQVAREMLNRQDWITPTLSGGAWLEKPPLYYWQAIVAYRIFGVSDWAARIPSAFDASLMVAAVYFFLRRFRPRFELDGALTVASSAGIIVFARAAATDMPLAAAFTVAMLAWYAWFENREQRYLMLFYLFLAVGTLAKGPVAVLLAALIILCFAGVKRNAALVHRTISLSGILLLCVVALPWYLAVEVRNPEFFKIFILQHNLARFGTNLYHHPEPFWYFGIVVVAGLIPWTFFALTELRNSLAHLRKADDENAYRLFLALWLIVPVIFFSISRSKLPGYILPSLPAGSLLVADYVRRRSGGPAQLWLVLSHAIAAGALLVPAVTIQYILLEHRIPWWRPAQYALGLAFVIAFVLSVSLKISGLRVLRTVTLIPVVLAVAILVRTGSPALDATNSARPLAKAISRIDPQLGAPSLPIRVAVFEAPRETEFGLCFYLNRSVSRYENHQIPRVAHLVVAPEGSQSVVAAAVAGRRVSYLGTFPAQRLDYFWISESTARLTSALDKFQPR